ncbi:MAG: DNA mismatch repair protein MutS [Chloroflexota bacterium]
MPKQDFDQLALLGADFLPTTPIRRQYLDLKARHPDAILLFRLGDFYETFDGDAEVVSRALDITLTGRDMGRGERIPMAGVPAHSAEGYISRLVEQGHRVALCEQIGEAPTRGLVHRDIVRVFSKGTLIEDGLLPRNSENFLAALLIGTGAAGLAFADVSTGRLTATEVSGAAWAALVTAEMVRVGPAECLVDVEGPAGQPLPELLAPGTRATPRPSSAFSPHRAGERLRSHFQTATVAALGLDTRPLAACATAALLGYIEESIPSALELFDRVDIYDVGGRMVLDSATRRSLELTANLASGQQQGSLLGVLDVTRTSMGARRLRSWISAPLLDLPTIRNRQDVVGLLVQNRFLRAEVARRLESLPDLERLSARAMQRLLAPRETLGLAAGLRELPGIRTLLSESELPLVARLAETLFDASDTVAEIERTVADPPAAAMGEGVIRDGRLSELDETRAIAGDTRTWIANLERTERERTGVRGLRVGYNRVFGYYLEITKSQLSQPTDYYQRERSSTGTVSDHLEKLGYVRRQTVANGERFITTQLQEYEIRVRNATEDMARLERKVFNELLDVLAAVAPAVRAAADALAQLDALVALAEVADRQGYCCPELVEEPVLEIQQGRHPVVESVLDPGAFVANDVSLGGTGRPIAILTGPNMAGKSTYLRQTALIVLMAQIGSWVPARAARVGRADRIFARVGAQDDLAAHRSTFMVEMIETAAILRSATPSSLLVLDEIGRGTSTFDGIAVARSVVEHIHNTRALGCRTLFATHYHELAELADELPGVSALRVDVLEHGDSVVFLHRVVEGAADRSYGIHVARLAGMPAEVITRAWAIAEDLESHRGSPRPTYRAHEPTSEPTPQSPVELRLREIDVATLTPIQAITLLDELSRAAASG